MLPFAVPLFLQPTCHHRQRVWQPAATGLVLGRGPLERSWFVAQAAWQGCENKPLQCPAESRSNTVEV